jgi:[protein-PII] uridylyltransferase
VSAELPADSAACAAAVRERFGAARSTARDRHAAGERASVIAADLAAEAERIVGSLHERALRLAPKKPQRHALVAAGGLGRRELAPASDLDLVLVAAERDHAALKPLVDAMLYPLWDARVDVGHAVRSPSLFADLAAADDTVRTTAVDWRPLAGDAKLIAELDERLASALAAAGTRRYLAAVVAEWTSQESPATVYRLEPNLKTGPGGLRELQRVWWTARLLWNVHDWSDLAAHIDPHDFATLNDSKEVLLGIRLAMHFLAGRRQDALRFDLQEDVARHLRLAPMGDQAPGDRLLALFYKSAKGVRSAASRVLESCARELSPPKRAEPVEIDGFVAQHGKLTVADAKHFESQPIDLIRAFRVAQTSGCSLHESLRARISEQAERLLTDEVCLHPAAAMHFLDVIGDSRRGGALLELMHELGVLDRILPDFHHCTGLVQRDTYHTYTVDAHLIYCARRAIDVLDGAADGVPEDVTAVAQRISRRRVLVLGALMHDIGKGWGHGHSERGAKMAEEAAWRFGLERDDADDIVFLVREHLTMMKLSQRRDLNDTELVNRFAALVETPERLDLLYVLSYVDATTTGPEAWNDWKASLLRELYLRARKALAGGAAKETLASRGRERLDELSRQLDPALLRHAQRLPDRHLVAYATSALVEHARVLAEQESARAAHSIHRDDRGGWHLVVAGRDRPGLLAELAAVLASAGVSIDAAHISSTTDGVIIDTFVVRAGRWPALDDDARRTKLAADLDQAIAGGFDAHKRLEERRKAAKVLKSGAPQAKARVVWDLEANADATVVDIFAPDRVGLLHDIANAIFASNASITLARISTEGERAVDAFYLVDAGTGRPLDVPQRAAVERAILEAVGPV